MSWVQRLWNTLRPGRLENDLARELSFHIEERADQLRAQGLGDDEARRLARRQFGNLSVEIERTRDMDITDWLDSSLRNIRYAVRTLTRTPGFTLTVVLTLALSIGANSALFSTLNAVLLRPLPFPDADRLVDLSQTDQRSTETLVAPIRLEDWNELNSTFEAMTGYNLEDVSETSGDLPEKVRCAFVAPRFFDVWGIAPALGRGFSPSDHRDGASPVVVVSDRYWRNHLAADPNVLNRTVRLDNLSYSIVGVMPASFRFPDRDVELWRPRIYNRFTQFRQATWYIGIGRMKPGISLSEARADLDVVQRQLAAQHPDTDSAIGVRIEPLNELSRADGGFDSSRVLTFRMSGSWRETGNFGQMMQGLERVLDGLRMLPGVESAAATVIPAGVPTAFEQELQLVERRADTDRRMLVENRAVTSSYFETMRIALVSGELCRHQPLDAPRGEVMVNRSFVERCFPGSSPVGLHVAGFQRPNRITGIVGDARERGLDRDPVPTVYYCGIPALPTRVFLLRTRGEPMAMAQAVRVRIKELEPLRSVYDITPLDERIGDSFVQNWLRTVLLVLFAVTALSLACVGLYGTLGYIVNLRRREVGLRLALGASRSTILKHFLTKGLRVVGLASACGVILSFALSRLLSGMLYGVSPSDPFTLSTVVLIVLLVAGIASLIPAARAAVVEPMQVLRNE
jgi:hypothetical protein